VSRSPRGAAALRGLTPVLLAATALGTGCATGQVRPWEYSPRPMADTLAIWEPAERDPSVVYELRFELAGFTGVYYQARPTAPTVFNVVLAR